MRDEDTDQPAGLGNVETGEEAAAQARAVDDRMRDTASPCGRAAERSADRAPRTADGGHADLRLTLDVDTPHGPARVVPRLVDDPRGALVLGHGAGGGVDARDIAVVTEAARAERFGVVLVEQPYLVAGRRSPAPAKQLDAAWLAVIEHLRAGELAGLPLVVGGRSAGARVACRTTKASDAAAALCLAFPVHPPGRPEKSRLDELDAVDVPVLVVQGESDPFGMPPPAPGREVVRVPGNHSLRADLEAVAAAAGAWLSGLKFRD